MARIKGTALRARLDYLAARFGEAGLQRVLGQLSAELHAEIANGVVISAWYPLQLSEAILGAAERLLGKGDGALCEAIGLASARRGLTSTYAAFAAQPEESEIADKMRLRPRWCGAPITTPASFTRLRPALPRSGPSSPA